MICTLCHMVYVRCTVTHESGFAVEWNSACEWFTESEEESENRFISFYLVRVINAHTHEHRLSYNQTGPHMNRQTDRQRHRKIHNERHDVNGTNVRFKNVFRFISGTMSHRELMIIVIICYSTVGSAVTISTTEKCVPIVTARSFPQSKRSSKKKKYSPYVMQTTWICC